MFGASVVVEKPAIVCGISGSEPSILPGCQVACDVSSGRAGDETV